MISVKKGSKIGMKTRSMYVYSSLKSFQRVPLQVGSSSFIVSRPRDLRNCSTIFVTAPRSLGPRSLCFRARLLPGSNQRSQGLRKNLWVPMWLQGSKDKKEARTPVQPKAHRGHYNFKRTFGFKSAISGSKPLGSNQRSPDLNLRGPISKTSGFQLDPRIYHRISGFLHHLWGPVMILGSRQGPPGPQCDLRIQGDPPGSSTTFGSPDDPRVLTQSPGYKINLQTPRVRILT
ncbi:hypothetical protein F2Q68_00015100 [Brassica cretica]|uniref:Uncharacterized protein n=1 Tax=Brassica cretica TaxID=69181 RepID=A0A8S9HF54_BRACR|nr:hypothetical protein F2Q68_00015100 [Brassica cretica]